MDDDSEPGSPLQDKNAQASYKFYAKVHFVNVCAAMLNEALKQMLFSVTFVCLSICAKTGKLLMRS